MKILQKDEINKILKDNNVSAKIRQSKDCCDGWYEIFCKTDEDFKKARSLFTDYKNITLRYGSYK